MSIYIPPSCNIADLDSLYEIKTENTIIGGDFNAHHTDWSVGRKNIRGDHISNWINTKNLKILNNKKDITHPGKCKKSSTPDLVLAGLIENISTINTAVLEGIGSDHLPILINLKFRFIENTKKFKVIIKNVDTVGFQNCIKQSIKELQNAKFWCPTYKSIIGKIIYNYKLNSKLKKVKTERSGQLWWTEALTKEIKIRNKLWKIHYEKPSILNRKNYLNQRNKVRKLIKEEKQNFWTKVNEEKNINEIHTLMRKLKKGKSKNIYYKENGRYLENNEVAQKFLNTINKNPHDQNKKIKITFINKFYQKINENDTHLLCKKIEKEEITEICNNLKSRKAPGLDCISNRMIIDGGNEMVNYLQIIYNKIYDEKKFPDEWNIGKIIPIPKIKRRNNNIRINELRPICLLSTIFKIFEKIMLNRLLKCENFKKQSSNKQFGFKKDYGTEDNLIILQSKIQNARSKKKILVVLFLDIKSAYDNVNRETLKEILKYILGHNKIYKFLEHFLGKRQIIVHVENESSNLEENLSGVPQGAALSPILFNLYIKSVSDIDNVYAYADDISVLVEGENENEVEIKCSEIIKKLNENLNIIDLSLSRGKSKYMVFTKKKIRQLKILNGEEEIDKVEKFKYLGITFDTNNTFKTHINNIKICANKKMGELKYLCNKITGCDSKTLINIYKSYVRSRIEYGSIVWSNASKDKIKKLDSLQHRFLCWSLGISYRTAVIDVLNDCNLQTLEHRRECMIVKYIKKEKIELILNQCKPISKKLDYKKGNIFIKFKNVLSKYGLTYEEIRTEEWKSIERKMNKKYKTLLQEIDKRNNNEAILTRMFINTFRSKEKRKHTNDSIECKKKRYEETIFNQLKFGVLQLNKFKNKMDGKTNPICPNLNCNAVESRSHFLFYCGTYEYIRKALFSSKRIKNFKSQEKLIRNKKLKENMLEFTKRALHLRNKGNRSRNN